MSTEIGSDGSSGTALQSSVGEGGGDITHPTKTPDAPKASETKSTEAPQGLKSLTDKISKATSGGATDGSSTENPMTSSSNPLPPSYTPNFKFKANQKEMEFDEFLRGAVTTPETEKKLRELYEKAYGLDTIKPERDQLKTQHQTLTQETTQLKSGLAQISHYVQNKDYESFFQALGIPKSDVMQYALMQIKLQEATPEARAAYEHTRQTSLNAYQLEQQNTHLQETLRQQATSMRSNELNLALQRPEVNQVMQAFDQRLGRVGAFREEVIKRGQLYWHSNQSDIPVDQAVGEVMSLIGTSLQGQGSTEPPAMTAVAEAPKQQPTIPSLKGRGTSPAKKVFKSLADIKQHAKEVIAAEG